MFSIQKRLQSFIYAFRGIIFFIRTQHNAWIHLFISFWVIFFGFFFQILWWEWGLLCLAMGLVLMAEAFNTAIELLVDFISPEYHQKAGAIKDVAAGAVLIAAIFSALIGLLVFVPKFWNVFF